MVKAIRLIVAAVIAATIMLGSAQAADPRPGKWCAWWLRRHLQIPISEFPKYQQNLARAFAKIGRAAGGPGIGVIVVWRGHVGIITGRAENGQWIVKSGNDGGMVRERLRPVGGAIAFRRWGWGLQWAGN